MTPGDELPEVDLARVQQVLAVVREQVAAALWLSAGMIFATAMIAVLGLGWRRPALACGLAYAATLCFVPNGHAQILGPIGCASALAGLLWRQK